MNRIASHRLGRALAAGVVSLMAVGASASAAHAVTPATTDPATSARLAARYLASIQSADGSVPGFNVASATADAALAFSAGGGPAGAFNQAVTYLEGHIADATTSSGVDTAGGLAKLILVAHAAGIDPNAFGGSAAANHLVDRLLATKRGASDAGQDGGLFGSQSPTYDGVFRQSLALMAVKAAGASVPSDATTWLSTQQCTDKGWMSYRAHTDATTLEACHGFDSNTFTGEDSNSTALATEALVALGATPTQGDPLDFLDAMQNSDGGFAQFAGDPTDGNSTGVVIQAIVAEGEDPAAGRWAQGGHSAVSALLALQIGCAGAAADRGAFAFQPAEDGTLTADSFATSQAVPGIAEAPLPLESRDLSTSIASLDCATPVTTGGGAVATTTSTTAASTVESAHTTPITLPATGAKAPPQGLGALAGLGLLLVLAGVGLSGVGRRPGRVR